MPKDDPIPEIYLCSITGQVMIDPVITADGHTYEREAIDHWLKTHDTSPVTGLKLEHKTLIENHDVRGEILGFLDINPELYAGDEVYLPKSWMAELIIAIKSNQHEEVKKWLDKDRRLLTVKLESDSTAFHLACEFSSPEIVDELLKRLEKNQLPNYGEGSVNKMDSSFYDKIRDYILTLERAGDYNKAIKFSKDIRIKIGENFEFCEYSFVKLYKDYEDLLKYMSRDFDIPYAFEMYNTLGKQLAWTIAYLLEVSALVNPKWLSEKYHQIQEQLNVPHIRDVITKIGLFDTFVGIMTNADKEVKTYKESIKGINIAARKTRDFVSFGGELVRKSDKDSLDSRTEQKLIDTYPTISQNNDKILTYMKEVEHYISEYEKYKQQEALDKRLASRISVYHRRKLLEKLEKIDDSSFSDLRQEAQRREEIYQEDQSALRKKLGESGYTKYLQKIEKEFQMYQEHQKRVTFHFDQDSDKDIKQGSSTTEKKESFSFKR